MFKNLNTEVEKIIGKSDDPDYLEYKKIQKRWEEKIEKKIKKNVKIIDFTKGTITLKAKNPAWKNEALFIQEEIKKKFQTKKTQ